MISEPTKTGRRYRHQTRHPDRRTSIVLIGAMLATVTIALVTPARASSCIDAARAAERRNGIPNGLLAAIGHVESGGWGLSVNGNDAVPGQRFADPDQAQRYVEELLASGRRMIDLGCFQVDLLYHPDAFRHWQDAFDSDANADAAAGILGQLHAHTGDWQQAVALYHSRDPSRGNPYMHSVMTAWKEGADPNGIASLPAFDPYVALTSETIPVAIWRPGTRSRVATSRTTTMLPRVVTP